MKRKQKKREENKQTRHLFQSFRYAYYWGFLPWPNAVTVTLLNTH